MQNKSLWGESMRIAEYKKISTRTEQRVVHHEAEYDDDRNIIAEAWDETVDVEVPVMGMAYRDATPEEITEMERQQAGLPEPEPTQEERLVELEAQNQMLTQCLMEMSQIVYA